MGDDHRLGVIEFRAAEDAGGGAGLNTHSIGARIQAIARDAWDGSNNDADLQFYTTDGTTESLVLTLDADKDATFAGDLIVAGDLNITGDINSTSVTDLDVTDLTITCAAGAGSSAAADGAGLAVGEAVANLYTIILVHSGK